MLFNRVTIQINVIHFNFDTRTCINTRYNNNEEIENTYGPKFEGLNLKKKRIEYGYNS